MAETPLVFRVREPGAAHPSSDVTATGIGPSFEMRCTCLAGLHGALHCPHIDAVLGENRDLVMSGKSQFAEMKCRLAGSRLGAGRPSPGVA